MANQMSEQRTTKDQLPEIRQLPAVEQRVETGPTAFGDDWPGVFIRGDHALLGYLPALQRAIADMKASKYPHSVFDVFELEGLAKVLASCSLVKP